jgi:hypothetical protein
MKQLRHGRGSPITFLADLSVLRIFNVGKFTTAAPAVAMLWRSKPATNTAGKNKIQA